MEINLHVCLPELGLTASWVCVKDLLIWTDLGQALHSVTGNNATEAQLKPTTTFSTTQADFKVFATFCTSIKTTPLSLFLPQTSLMTAPLGKGKKISFHTSIIYIAMALSY